MDKLKKGLKMALEPEQEQEPTTPLSAEKAHTSPPSPVTTDQQPSPYFREYNKYLPEKSPNGLYVVPSFDSPFEWHCVLFIRQGLYRKGIFKFIVDIPSNYPESCPKVKFITKVFHPQVNEEGLLNTQREFPVWDAKKNFIWQLLTYVKKIFYKIDTSDSFNSTAADLFNNNQEEFRARVSECVEESIKDVFVNTERTSLHFSEWRPEYEPTKQAILCRKLDSGDKSENLLSWVSSNVTKLLNIKY